MKDKNEYLKVRLELQDFSREMLKEFKLLDDFDTNDFTVISIINEINKLTKNHDLAIENIILSANLLFILYMKNHEEGENNEG